MDEERKRLAAERKAEKEKEREKRKREKEAARAKRREEKAAAKKAAKVRVHMCWERGGCLMYCGLIDGIDGLACVGLCAVGVFLWVGQ